jgi:hypothetical protein
MFKKLLAWLRNAKELVEIVVWLLSLPTLTFTVLRVFDLVNVHVALDVAQALVIVAIVVHAIYFTQVRVDYGMLPDPSRAVDQFNRYWIYLWMYSWLPLYLFFSGNDLAEKCLHLVYSANWSENWFNFIANVLNNCQAIWSFALFLVLTRPTLEKGTVRIQSCFVLVAVLGVVEGLLRLNSHTEQDSAGSIVYSIVHPDTFSHVSGILCALSLSLFVGRLESPLLDIPIGRIALLYCYCVIQPLFPFLRSSMGKQILEHDQLHVVVREFLKPLAGVLKVLLYVWVNRLLTSGRLLFFFQKIQALTVPADYGWSNFLEKHSR